MPPKGSKSSASPAIIEDDEKFKKLDSKLDVIISQLSEFNVRITSVERKTAEFEDTFEYHSKEISDLRAEVKELKQSKANVEKKLDSFDSLSGKVDASEQASRGKCIELNGIPHSKDENLLEGFKKILKNLKLDYINPMLDIDNMYRIRQTSRVIIRFLHTSKRDKFFIDYRRNIQDTSSLGFSDKAKIYINEVLSRSQNELFWKTRNFKKEHSYRFIWTFKQKIYLRKTPDSDAIEISSEQDLDTLKLV
ncbi:uncharacterized protein [Watersipora subatra]|uniref:uncharacterized protein n=1 Tax=Watersipora subatra TaxID=2589382 RepID=UPI00355AF7EF